MDARNFNFEDEAPDKKPDWTTEKPTEPGFYWAKAKPGYLPELEPVFVSSEGTVHASGEPGGDWDRWIEFYWPVKLEPPA